MKIFEYICISNFIVIHSQNPKSYGYTFANSNNFSAYIIYMD